MDTKKEFGILGDQIEAIRQKVCFLHAATAAGNESEDLQDTDSIKGLSLFLDSIHLDIMDVATHIEDMEDMV